jgi:hypothetical protein
MGRILSRRHGKSDADSLAVGADQLLPIHRPHPSLLAVACWQLALAPTVLGRISETVRMFEWMTIDEI